MGGMAVVTNGDMKIGYCTIPEVRKKPCIIVEKGNTGYILGTFKNENDAKFFFESLKEFVNAVEENNE